MSISDRVVFANDDIFFLADVGICESYGTAIPANSDIAAFLKKKLSALTSAPPSSKNAFPISQPSSFRRSTIQSLYAFPYCVALKTDGERRLLLLTRFQGKPIACFCDRKMNLRKVEIWAPLHFFDDTLLDGELVHEAAGAVPARDVFLVFDAYTCSGQSLVLDDYDVRVDKYRSIIHEPSHDVEEEPALEMLLVETNKISFPPRQNLFLKPKAVANSVYDSKAIWERRLITPHLNDGLIFTPNTVVLTDRSVYKWKPTHTIDVLIFGSDAGKRHVKYFRPHLQHCGEVTHITSLTVEFDNTFNGQKKVSFKANQIASNEIVELALKTRSSAVLECAINVTWSDTSVSFLPIRERADKTMPNSVYVGKETIISVIEDVKIHEFWGKPHVASGGKRARAR